MKPVAPRTRGTPEVARASRESPPQAVSIIERQHAEKVARISEFLQARHSAHPLSIKKRTVSHLVPKRGDPIHSDDRLDVSDLDAILGVDPGRLTCTVEPGVPFCSLVDATLPLGLLPPVVPELKTITPGGAVAGCSLESMSFRHGGFHDNCLEYEVVDARGNVLRCAPSGSRRLLFEMLHGSFGTLGVLTEITFRLVPALRFVHVLYERHDTIADFARAIREHSQRRDVDFIDGMIHSPTHYVVALGTFTDAAPYTHRYDWLGAYYRSTALRPEDYLATPQYLFRYDRGVTNVTPRTWAAQLALGRWFDSSRVLRLAQVFHKWLPRDMPVTTDLLLPLSRMGEYLQWHERELGHYPLWCVPYRPGHRYEWINPSYLQGVDDELFVDIAIYGMRPQANRNTYRLIEEEMPRVKGLKALLGHNLGSEEEFWRTWNRPNYEAVKAQMDPDGVFRDLYTKTRRSLSAVAP